LLTYLVYHFVPDIAEEQKQLLLGSNEDLYEASFLNYGEGSFADQMLQRATDWLQLVWNLAYAPFLFLPIFLLGAYAWTSGMIRRILDDAIYMWTTMMVSLMVGVAFTALKEYCRSMRYLGQYSLYDVGLQLAGFVGDIGLATFYATLLLMFARQPWLLRPLQLFQWAGRMSLTHYVFQSIVCGLLFYNIGLGWYGKVELWLLMLLVMAIFVLQMMVSRWWFWQFRYGPLEWVWRKGTYGRSFNK
jgi:uncharacterized protein